MTNLRSEAGTDIAVFLGGLVLAVGAIITTACYLDDKNHKRKQKTSGVNLSGPSAPKEGVISYPEGSQFIIVLHADGKTTIMAGPESGPWVFAGGRIRLISGTNSIVIEK